MLDSVTEFVLKSMPLPVKVRAAPLPVMERVFVSSSKIRAPRLVSVSDMVRVLALLVPSRFNIPAADMVVVPPTVMLLELESNVPLVISNAPDNIRSSVKLKMAAPPESLRVRLFKASPSVFKVLVPLVAFITMVELASPIVASVKSALPPTVKVDEPKFMAPSTLTSFRTVKLPLHVNVRPD